MNSRAYQVVRDKRAWEGPREPEEAAHEAAIGARGWYTRGYLPHFDKPGTIQMFTFRLADSMPVELRHEWAHLLAIEDERERRTRLEAYLDRGRGACVLRDPRAAAAVENALLHSHERRYRLCAWVVMPNHVHVLVELWDLPMGELLKVWKGASSHAVNRLLGRRGELWQRDYWDRYMRDEAHFRKTRHYIEWNPVKAGLVRAPEEWAFSSANPHCHHSAERSADIPVGENPSPHTDVRPTPYALADKNVGAPLAVVSAEATAQAKLAARSADIPVGENPSPQPGAQSTSHAPADKNVGAPTALRRGAWLLALLLLLTAPLRADEGLGESPLFTVDTRYGSSEGFGTSASFTLDTRHSGSTGQGASGLFTVDTTGALVADARIFGAVTTSNYAGIPGATVNALQNDVLRATATTDPQGTFQLPPLPAGTYQLRAQKPNHLTALRYGVALAPGQIRVENFVLAARPPDPVVVEDTRPPEPPDRPVITSPQLLTYAGGQFVPNGPFDPAKPTVVLTHGWNSDPTVWARGMAASMMAGGADANILAWDWQTQAGTGIQVSRALGAVPEEGIKLAGALSAAFGPSYRHGLHFIGHSLGTLVNAEAANRLHQAGGDLAAWLRLRTHLTLLDNAAVANVEGSVVSLGYASVDYEQLYQVGGVFTCGWLSPVPEHYTWLDNYISLVGYYTPSGVNVWLSQAPEHGDTSGPLAYVQSVHGYAARWYGYTAANPSGTILGHRYSFEQQGSFMDFPGVEVFPPGVLYSQQGLGSGELALQHLRDESSIRGVYARTSAKLGQFGVRWTVQQAVGLASKVGNAVVDVVEAGVSYVVSAADRAVQQFRAWSLRVILRTKPGTSPGLGGRQPKDGDGDDNQPRVWIPVEVPADAALFAFDFERVGGAGDDFLVMSIGGTNVFALELRYMPTNTVLNSGPIVVSPWAGQTVEFYFGLSGGTSTNASLTLGAMRFYQLASPTLTVLAAGGQVVVAWPATATGYTLETTTTVNEPASWTPVVQPPALIGLQNVVTNGVSGEARFYRLRK